MKLMWCGKCGTLTSLVSKHVRYCKCKKCAGKYLKDNMTSVVNKNVVLVGIDNNTFNIAWAYQQKHLNYPSRLDFFFTGWIPTKPGESITVETTKDVKDYPFEEFHNTESTMPVSQQ